MPRVGFQPTIPAFERAKTVHALDRAATVIGCYVHNGTVSPNTLCYYCKHARYVDSLVFSLLKFAEQWMH
jgi:hypothetical protein